MDVLILQLIFVLGMVYGAYLLLLGYKRENMYALVLSSAILIASVASLLMTMK